MIKYLLIVFALSITFESFSQSIKLYPKNEVHKDSSLTSFVCRLQYAIFKKDKNYLLSVVDKDVKNSFGGDDGIEEFKKIWQLDKADSPVWFYLSKLISLGGTFSSYNKEKKSLDSFVFPYIQNAEGIDEAIDVFATIVIVAEHVNIREKPDRNSKSLGQLSYEVVNVDYEKSYPAFSQEKIEHVTYYGEKEWYYITTMDKKISGYVYWEYAWSFVGYRLFVNKINNQWKIVCLISGD